ncbi:histone demethylase Ecym_7196 [Eremothecium cymbalariae DBVPG|uniref:Histone demethylase JHD2 n=1 Tax=Eremothecium cymbalariae (strain CBS 270.75 / DBVPG 7215 / KCTC 17166 / NRRL Y-17582) TaxID=931890 RepID=G8JW29_ERECY|nr:hypothetical protein Ecym_7196 [Eremothecium cymbalariae DBVPG\
MSKIALGDIPVLHPTDDEFRDPIGFLSQPAVQRMGHIYGMIKLVPPSSFQPPMTINENNFRFHVRLQTLSELGLLNRSRLFFMKQLNNFLRGHSQGGGRLADPYYVVKQDIKIYYYDLFIEVLKFYNKPIVEENETTCPRKRIRDDPADKQSVLLKIEPLVKVLGDGKLWRHLCKVFHVSNDVLVSIFKSRISKYYQFLHKQSLRHEDCSFIKRLIYEDEEPKSLIHDDSDSDSNPDSEYESDLEDACVLCHKDSPLSKMILCNSCRNLFHKECLNPNLTSPIDNNWVCSNCIVGTGYYGFKEEDHEYTLKEFRSKCVEFDKLCFPEGKPVKDINFLEGIFWSLVSNIDSKMTTRYGADIHNNGPGEVTAFPTLDWIPSNIKEGSKEFKDYVEYANHPMNLLNLPRADGSLLPVFGRMISGMTVPWVYIGSTFSTFCWHLEDQYTLSANYQHEGDPKVWYSIPEHSSRAFHRMMREISPDLFEKQPDLMHQLVTLVSPYEDIFQKAGISCYKTVQLPGEYIVTYPKCYHAGFNTGYNFNEAVNFTLDLWVPYGLRAIKDYKLTGKRCVFDMWELMLNVLIQYLVSPRKFQEALIRRCHLELLTIFNSEMKIIQQLQGVIKHDNMVLGFERNTIDYSGNVISIKKGRASEKSGSFSNDEEQDLFCSLCKTICPFAFVVHYRMPNSHKRRRLQNMTPAQWNQLDAKKSLSILCLEDYLKLVEQVESDERTKQLSDSSGDDDMLDIFDNDELYYIRHPDDIRDLLQRAEKKIDSYL